jgi:hypothetical protein
LMRSSMRNLSSMLAMINLVSAWLAVSLRNSARRLQ